MRDAIAVRLATWALYHTVPEGAAEFIRQLVADRLPAVRFTRTDADSDDEPCVCDTDFTCLATEHDNDA